MTTEACTTPPRATISRAEATADAAMVERVVRRGWAGLEAMTKRGVDFDAVFAELARWIDDAPEPIAVATFQERLVTVLRPAADNHMAFFEYGPKGHTKRRSVGRQELAYTADLGTSQIVECEGHGVGGLMKPTLITGATGPDAVKVVARPIVLASAPPRPLRCRVRSASGAVTTVVVPLRRLRAKSRATTTPAQAAATRPAFERRDGPIPLLTVHTFWTAKETELAAFVTTGEKLRDAKAIVVDVRGNEGGSDTYAKDWIAQLTNATVNGPTVDRLDSDVTRQGIVNENTCEIAKGVEDATALRDIEERLAYGRRVVNEAENADVPLRVWKPRTVTVAGRSPTPFTAPLVVLVDSACASACESFVSYARQLPGTVVVGENTGGVGVFGEVLVYRLPKSGLGMSAGMKYFHDPDPAREVPEGRGHLPDYWLDTDDPVIDATRLAECLTKATCPLRRK